MSLVQTWIAAALLSLSTSISAQIIVFDAGTGTLSIPSVKVGSDVYTGVTMALTDPGTLTFSVRDATLGQPSAAALATYDPASAILTLPSVMVLQTTSAVSLGKRSALRLTPKAVVESTYLNVTLQNVGNFAFRLLSATLAPTNPVDAQAVSLATQILKGGSQTGAAVTQALLATGFAIQAPDGSLALPTSSASQGMLVTQWDVDVMAAGTNGGGFITLYDLAAAIQLAFPELDTNLIVANILAGIGDSAQSDQSTVRLWARLIVELGRQRDALYDLLNPAVDPTQVDLDPVQFNLIINEFLGDVVSAQNDVPAANAVTLGARRTAAGIGSATGRARALATTAPPCTLTDTQQMIMDQAAKAETKGFKQLVKYLESKGVAGAGTLGKISGRLSAVLTYAKLLASLLAFNETFSANLDELVRTLSRVNGGQQMKITATVSFDNGNAQLLNCVRQVGNLIGVDFKLTPTGVIKNAEIIWYLLDGGTNGIAGQLGYLRWAQGSLPNVGRFTDANGQDTITIEGAPQSKVLIDPHSVEKPGKVHAKINLKSANIVQDLMDALGGASTLPIEMAYRTGLGFERSYSFTVVDWEDCTTPTAAARIGIKDAGVCRDTWTGTSSFTLGADPLNGPTTSAGVTWVLTEIDGTVARYQPTGTATYSWPGSCSFFPNTWTMSTTPGGGTGGQLAIDFGADPPTYQVSGATVWAATYCGGFQAGAGGSWLGDPNTGGGPVSGSLSVSPDTKTNTQKLTIQGNVSSQYGSSIWNFTKD
jgi:hypothetical protein